MATSRVGGTKGLLTGSVGGDTYYVQNDGNGNITQVVQQKKTTHTNTKTTRLAVQQMCTAIIEAMMRDLKPLIKISFQSAKNKTTSCNMFSQQGLMTLAQACRQHWYDNSDFYFPYKSEKAAVSGPFLLSSGSLPYNAFQGFGSIEDYSRSLAVESKPSWILDYNGAGVWFSAGKNVNTVGEFMKANRLTYSTMIGAAAFYEYINIETEKTYVGYKVALISINPEISPSSAISENALRALFRIQTKDPFSFLFNPKNNDCVVGSFFLDRDREYTMQSGAAFTRDYYLGRLYISDSIFHPLSGSRYPYITNQYPSQVLWSWLDLDTAQIIDYPW